MNDVRTLGVMIDLSRNALLQLESLKRFISLLSRMGYNMVMLYTEDTYEIEGEPYFGYMRARYSKAQLREIDAYCSSLGVELIPCIQTLAHLGSTLRWGKIPREDADCMLVDDERTYEMIGKMLDTVTECFSSKRIHIGMDEAAGIGRGKHLDIHGYEEPTAILGRHLARVTEMVEERGLTPMIWSDMFFRTWNGGNYEEAIEKCEVPREIIESVPKSCELVYWAYSNDWVNIYDDMLYNHLQITDKLWFAGGAWGWVGLTPLNTYSITTMKTALDACKKYGVKDIMITLWSCYGAEGSRFAQLPALYAFARYALGETDDEKIKRGFYELVGVKFDDFLLLDIPNGIGSPAPELHRNNPSHYMLYSDPLHGYLDYTVAEGGRFYFTEAARKLRLAARRAGEYSYLFKTEAALSEVLALKYDLGVRLREAYKSSDRQALMRISDELSRLVSRLRSLIVKEREQWYLENYVSGFEVIELRLGGLIERIRSVEMRLDSYLRRDTDVIEELEVELLPYGNKGKSMLAVGAKIFTTNVYL